MYMSLFPLGLPGHTVKTMWILYVVIASVPWLGKKASPAIRINKGAKLISVLVFLLSKISALP